MYGWSYVKKKTLTGGNTSQKLLQCQIQYDSNIFIQGKKLQQHLSLSK